MTDRTTPLAFLCHPYHRGGVTRWMIDAATEWARRGRPTWFVTPRPTRPFLGGAGRPTMVELLTAAADQAKITLVTPPVGASFELGSGSWRACEYASALIGGVPAGVPVVVSDDEPVWRAASWCHDRNPVIGVLHADDEHYYTLARQYHDRVSALVAVSGRIVRRVWAMLDGMTPGAERIPCGVELGAPRAVQGSGDASSAHLVWIGRVDDEQKRATDIPKIALELRQAGVPFTIDVVGDGPVRKEVQDHVTSVGLSDSVRFLGWQPRENVRQALERASLLLSTSNFEGMPLVIMEALAAGCGVVASRVSGIEDYAAADAAAGCLWTYDVGDVDGAATAIQSAVRANRESVARRARAFAEEEFSIERCMERYESLLRNLTAVRGRAPRIWPHRLAAAASPLLALARSVRARPMLRST